MAKVILVCGKICSGKSTYSEKLRKENRAVLLSVDEITLSLFGQHAGEKHDDYVERTEKYLFDKSLEITEKGIDVILDWGFWQKRERNEAKAFYNSRNIDCELHYIKISEEVHKQRLSKRNADVLLNKVNAYYIDENIALKFTSLFEEPENDEIDLIINE